MQNNRGFSLVELMVAMAILAFITVGFVLQYSTTSYGERVHSGVIQTVGALKEARYNATAVQRYKDTDLFPSYGVYFDMKHPDQVIVYADCDVDTHDRSSFIFASSSTACNGENGIVDRIKLKGGSQISAIMTVGEHGTSSVRSASVEFLRPLPIVWITENGKEALQYGYLELQLSIPGDSRERVVRIYDSGMITPTLPNQDNG